MFQALLFLKPLFVELRLDKCCYPSFLTFLMQIDLVCFVTFKNVCNGINLQLFMSNYREFKKRIIKTLK